MTAPIAPAAATPASQPLGVSIWPLVLITGVNYLWQIPYAVHHYGHRWESLPRLSIPLILTGVWFGAAVVAVCRGRRGGRVLLGSFLALEAAFYVVHNVSGAFGADLPGSDPILLIASILGYLSAATAIIYLLLLLARSPNALVNSSQPRVPRALIGAVRSSRTYSYARRTQRAVAAPNDGSARHQILGDPR